MEQHETEMHEEIQQEIVSDLSEQYEQTQEKLIREPADGEIPDVPKERYFGSVRFFKNMILLAVMIMIAIPTGISVYTIRELHETEIKLADAIDQYEALSQSEMIWYGWEAESPYAELYPDFYAPQPLSEGVRKQNVIYLTFDDGPSARTGEILDVLKEKNAKATFFVVCTQNENNQQMMKRIVEEGHTLAMHTGAHNYTKMYASVEAYLADMYQIFTQIKEVTGTTPSLFRFPGGSINNYNSGISHELIAEMLRRGFVPFDWNISSRDASTVKLLPAETIVENVVAEARNQSYGIVLMHDSAVKTTTAKAVGPMIDRLSEMGFTFEALTPETKSMLFAYGK